MTLNHGLGRVGLGGLACALLTIVPIGLLFGWVAMLFAILAVPLAAICYAVALLIFGFPLLWLWPSAFERGARRGSAAAAIGASVALLPASVIFLGTALAGQSA